MLKCKIYYIVAVCFFFISSILAATDKGLVSLEEAFLTDCINGADTQHSYAALQKHNPKRAAVLKNQAEAVQSIFRDVLKTEKQLIPKQCNYIVMYGYSGCSQEELQKALNNLRLALFANADRPSMQLFLTGSKDQIALFKEAALKTPVNPEKIITLESTGLTQTARHVIAQIVRDSTVENYDMNNLLYRRILLLTKASGARIGYAAFTAALGANPRNMILDCFSSLDISRKALDSPSKSERRTAFMELKTTRTDTRE